MWNADFPTNLNTIFVLLRGRFSFGNQTVEVLLAGVNPKVIFLRPTGYFNISRNISIIVVTGTVLW